MISVQRQDMRTF